MVYSLNSELLFIVSFLTHLIISITIIVISSLKKTQRTKYLPLLFGINCIMFLSIISIIPNFVELEPIDFFAFIGYSLILSYVIVIEIPGYILLSKHDSNLEKILQDFRQNCIQLNYDFNIVSLRNEFNINENIFNELNTKQLIENFIKRCETIENLDSTLYGITIKEIGEEIQYISRSKHPFPKLIEIFSLAGLSFLLSQFLTHLF